MPQVDDLSQSTRMYNWLADRYAEEQEKVKTAEAEIERLRLSEKECLRTMRNMVWKSNEVYDVWHLTEQELYTTKATLDQTCQERNELKAEIEQLRDMLGGRRFYTAVVTEAIVRERDELKAELEQLKTKTEIVELGKALDDIQVSRDRVTEIIARGQGTWPTKTYIKQDRWCRLQGELVAYNWVLYVLRHAIHYGNEQNT